MIWRFLSMLLLISVYTPGVCAEAGQVVITRVAAAADQQYEVTAGPCIKHRCPIAVVLRARGHQLDRHALEVESASASFEKDDLEQGDGAGDPSYLKPSVTVWSSGEEETETTLAIFPFRLAPGLNGILIDQRYGFEHVKRRHILLAAKDSKLIELWKESEGAGPTYSTTAMVDIAGGRQALLFYSFFSDPRNDTPDKLRVQSLAYGAATGAMTPYSIELSELTIGPFPTIAEARKQYAAKRSCSPWLWVLPAKEFGKPGGSGYVLATVASTSEVAQSVKAEARKCGFAADISLFSMKRDSIDLW